MCFAKLYAFLLLFSFLLLLFAFLGFLHVVLLSLGQQLLLIMDFFMFHHLLLLFLSLISFRLLVFSLVLFGRLRGLQSNPRSSYLCRVIYLVFLQSLEIAALFVTFNLFSWLIPFGIWPVFLVIACQISMDLYQA